MNGVYHICCRFSLPPTIEGVRCASFLIPLQGAGSFCEKNFGSKVGSGANTFQAQAHDGWQQ